MSYSKLDQGNEQPTNDEGQFMEVRSVNSKNQPQWKQNNKDTDYKYGPYYIHGSKSQH
jgi:hypothetical protein